MIPVVMMLLKLITESGDGCLRRCVAAQDALKKTGLLEAARAIALELNLFVNNLEVDGSQLRSARYLSDIRLALEALENLHQRERDDG